MRASASIGYSWPRVQGPGRTRVKSPTSSGASIHAMPGRDRIHGSMQRPARTCRRLRGDGSRAMKPPPFTYHDPRSVPEALELLARLPNAKVLAGGQSLMPMLNFRLLRPEHLVDLNRVAGLDHI